VAEQQVHNLEEDSIRQIEGTSSCCPPIQGVEVYSALEDTDNSRQKRDMDSARGVDRQGDAAETTN
jgi:hypothetical protein